jgi:hypothetical protein
MMGRPPTSKPTAEQKEDLIRAISEGESMRSACERIGTDRYACLREIEADPDFRTSIARAREFAGEAHADRAGEIIDKVERGELDPQAGRVILAGLQWQAAKQAPKRFSERMTLAGDRESPLQQASDEQIDARIKELLSKGAA